MSGLHINHIFITAQGISIIILTCFGKNIRLSLSSYFLPVFLFWSCVLGIFMCDTPVKYRKELLPLQVQKVHFHKFHLSFHMTQIIQSRNGASLLQSHTMLWKAHSKCQVQELSQHCSAFHQPDTRPYHSWKVWQDWMDKYWSQINDYILNVI